MKRIFYITIILFTTKLIAQDFSKVDQKVLNYPEYYDLYKLTNRISKDFDSDLDKVRAVYTWITDNIAYSYRASERLESFTFYTQEEYKRKKQLQKIRTAKSTIIKKAAVCHGYATLFNEMCDLLKIESKYIKGMAKNQLIDIGKKYETNHAWNMVTINHKKYLIDVTWGAGTYDVNNGFEKKPTYFYFFTDPEKFIKNHYPDDFKNSLLTQNVSKSTFQNTPIYYIRNDKNYKLLSPKTGKINNTKFIYKVDEKIKWVSYLIENKFYNVKNYKIQNDSLSFRIYPNNYKLKDVLIYINGKAINGFKFR